MNHKNKFSNYTKSQLLTAIDESIIGFKAQRNRDMVKRKLCDGLTFKKIAEEFDMSVRQTKTIIYEQELKIVKYLE